jgi:glycerol-3-phosphate acyltransferase PlsY
MAIGMARTPGSKRPRGGLRHRQMCVVGYFLASFAGGAGVDSHRSLPGLPPDIAPYHRALMLVALFILGAFLAGSIPTGLLIGKAKGIDIRTVGSKNIGATNVGRIFGRRYFFLCFAIDFAKSLVPVALAGWWLGGLGVFDLLPLSVSLAWMGVMAAAVFGNIFNPWLGFKGGKGVATSIGAIMGVFPVLALPAAGAFVVWIATLKLKGYISLASIAAAAALPIFTAAQFVIGPLREGRPGQVPGQPLADSLAESLAHSLIAGSPYIAICAFLAALVIWKHRTNIARLRAGTEPKAGARTN